MTPDEPIAPPASPDPGPLELGGPDPGDPDAPHPGPHPLDPGAPERGDADPRYWQLTLYVLGGGSLDSSNAIAAIRRICENELAGRVSLQILDIRKHPEALEADHVLAIPTLIKRLPPPLRRIVGDLSDASILRAALDLDPLPEPDDPSSPPG